MTFAQTISSVPGFLTNAECDRIVSLMQEAIAGMQPHSLRAGERGASVHRIDGEDWQAAARRYEPRGRIELTGLPPDVVSLMSAAYDRAAARLATGVRSRACDGWMYLEYGPDQYIVPHVDYPVNELNATARKVAAISVQLNSDFQGGNFFVETFAEADCWLQQQHVGITLPPGAVRGTPWFDSLRTTRWVSQRQQGTALVYGSNVIHGTLPVLAGTVRKMVGFLTE